MTLQIRASATIEQGVTTNRVKVQKRRRQRTSEPVAKPPKRVQQTTPGYAKRRYIADPLVRGLDSTTVMISLPVAELVDLDAACERAQMARSHFIRQAVKHFAIKVLGER